MLRAEAEDRKLKAACNRRLLLVGGVQAAGLAIISARLFQLQVQDQTRYGFLSYNNRTSQQIVTPVRGRIFDRFGEPLVIGEEAYRAILIPSFADDVRQVVRLVSSVVAIEDAEIDRIVARASRQRPNEPVILASDMPFEAAGQIGLLAPQLPGVQVERAERRRYVRGSVGGHIVGHVGHVEQVAIDDDPMLKLPWVRVGRSGIEHGMEAELGGHSGRARIEVDARGRIVRLLDRTEPTPGQDVVATIDIGLQGDVERRLDEHRCAAAVVMHVATGEVLAMASVPGYDPGQVSGHMAGAAWRRLAGARDKPLFNRAIGGQYPPGSTFKMVTALAALEAGVVDAGEHITCTGSHTYADQTYRCWNRSGHGRMAMVDALRESCDVYFYHLAERVGIDRLAAMARRLGFGQTYASGLSHQQAGLVPDRDWKRGHLNRSWLGGETILAGIGQGYVLATPLQLAVMTARIASGLAIEPTLVRRSQETAPAAEPKSLDIAGPSLEIVRRGMFEAVNMRGGTGARARIEAGGPVIAGKTGTSQVRRSSHRNQDVRWEWRDHALFVAFAPAAAPRFAISVIVEHGGAGGAVAAPIAGQIMQDVMARDPLGRPAITPLTVGAPRTPGAAGELSKPKDREG